MRYAPCAVRHAPWAIPPLCPIPLPPQRYPPPDDGPPDTLREPPPTTSSDPFRVGTVIAGKYQVEWTLAAGSMGGVVVARHLQLDRLVAIKHLHPQLLGNTEAVERFEREARLAATLASAHVVRVHDVDTLPEGGPYIVMEYLEGIDLHRLLTQRPLEVKEAVGYALEVCTALAEAHALGIVHRDLKPQNLYLAKRPAGPPVIKILDFGISKLVQRSSDGEITFITATNQKFGTPLYMSPEQLQSTARVDQRTDIWSLGVTLFELLTSQQPFAGDNVAVLVRSILVSPPLPLAELRPDAPAGLEAVLRRCLEKDPEKRYPNVTEVGKALAPFGPSNAPALVDAIERAATSAEARRQAAKGGAAAHGDRSSTSRVDDEPTTEPVVEPETDPPTARDSGPRSQARAPSPILGVVIALALVGTLVVWKVRETESRRPPPPASPVRSAPSAPSASNDSGIGSRR